MTDHTPDYHPPKIDTILTQYKAESNAEFIALAMACLDQADFSIKQQGKIANLIEEFRPGTLQEIEDLK